VYKEIFAVSSHIHMKPISTFCEQNVGFLNVKPSGTFNVYKNPRDATLCRYLFTSKLLYMSRSDHAGGE